jgi:hypothetical protein
MKNQTTEVAINTRTAWRPILKPVARLLIAAQLALVLQPLSVLAQEKGQAPTNPVAQAQLQRMAQSNRPLEVTRGRQQRTPADAVSEKLAQAQEIAAQLKSGRTVNRGEKHQQLKSLLREVNAGAADVRAEFAATRAELQKKNLPAEILARHDEAAGQFEQRAAQFAQIEASQASDDEKAAQVDQFFRRYPAKKRHTPIDPGKLPWGSPKATPRMPAETKTAWFQKLTRDQKVQLAQTGGLTTIGGVQFTIPPEPGQAPSEADLAETPDVQLTPAIRAKAQELGYSPVNIHNWVANNIQWLPTWGSIQGADGTLKTLRGNAFDTASLTIALLRASGIPARYQFGTIDVPVDAMMNWIGGVQEPEAALNLLYQGGVAARGIVFGGRFATIRMEHVWVNAYVNWTPSRGARQGGALVNPPALAPHGQPQHPNPNGHLNFWVPIDASAKQYDYTAGMPLASAVPVDAAAILASVQEGATATPSFVQHLNKPNVQAAFANYQESLRAYINWTPTGASSTIADIAGRQSIRQQVRSLLPGTTRWPVVVAGNERTELPESLRWRITFKLYASDTDRAYGSPMLTSGLRLSQIGTRRIAVTPVPATEADQTLLAQYAASGATSLPLYLIRQRVQLKLDDQVLAETPAQQMGAVQWWTYELSGPNFGVVEEDFKYETAVGDAIVFGVDAAGVDARAVAQRYAAVDPNTAHENLHHLNLGYFFRADWSDQALAKLQGFVVVRLPSVGLFASPLTIQYSWGVPRKGSFSSYAVDIRRLSHASVKASTNAATDPVSFNVQIGMKNSHLEGAVFEDVFDLSKGRGVSAISVLNEASYNGLGIHEVNASNLGEFLAAASGLSVDIQDAVAHYASAGYVVLAPASPASTPNWDSQGYVALDPETGAGAYIIATGANGGELLECEEKTEPLTKTIGDRILTILVIAAAAALVAAGILGAPPTGGGSLAGSGVAVAKMMAVFGMTYLVFSADASAANKCPSDKCHRGRIQAQGGRGAVAAELSVKWELVNPLTKTEAYALVDQLAAMLTTRQFEIRATAFDQMRSLIASMPVSGVCSPFSRSKPQPPLADGVRVDIEVNAGQALVN